MTTNTYLAFPMAERWHGFWRGDIGEWILTTGLHDRAAADRRHCWWPGSSAGRPIGSPAGIDAGFQESDALVRSESAKHRQAVASVISWVSIALLCVMVVVEITDILAIPVGSLVAPAAVLGAALGFGAQRIVQDLLGGFFIITEKQYGFGDLVALTIAGCPTTRGAPSRTSRCG